MKQNKVFSNWNIKNEKVISINNLKNALLKKWSLEFIIATLFGVIGVVILLLSIVFFDEIGFFGVLIGAILLLCAMAYYTYLRIRLEKKYAEASKKENDRNLTAIHKLIGEIDGLKHGKLNKQVTIGNGITNEIALALNSTVSNLRKLVLSIHQTTNNVIVLTENTEQLTTNIDKYTVEQENKLDQIIKNISSLAKDSNDIVQQTLRSSALADQALTLSKHGKFVITNTIVGMDAVRETIQETSKRIKSLGESSQEIGLVTQLIRNVGAKIHILALNAAIQSADAGEAGKGFAVVAEEVQALADEAAEAAQKIDSLIQNIQRLAKEAISTMEVVTSKVIEETQTTDNAGKALYDIGQATEELQSFVIQVTGKMQEDNKNVENLVVSINQMKKISNAIKEILEELHNTTIQIKNSTSSLQESIHTLNIET